MWSASVGFGTAQDVCSLAISDQVPGQALIMSGFSVPRLEGRALEHEMAMDGGRRIRMRSSDGAWVWVSGRQAADVRTFMKKRWAEVRAAMAQSGLHRRRADCPVNVSTAGGLREPKSVDLVLWCSSREKEALVEVKWTRRSLPQAISRAERSLPWLRRACETGRWHSSRAAVKAELVGVLAITPTSWQLCLEDASGPWSGTFPVAGHLSPMKRRSGASGWARYRAGARPGDPRWPSGASGPSGWPARNASRKAGLAKRPAASGAAGRAFKRPAAASV